MWLLVWSRSLFETQGGREGLMNPKSVRVSVTPVLHSEGSVCESLSHLSGRACSKWEVTLDTNKHFKIGKGPPWRSSNYFNIFNFQALLNKISGVELYLCIKISQSRTALGVGTWRGWRSICLASVPALPTSNSLTSSQNPRGLWNTVWKRVNL